MSNGVIGRKGIYDTLSPYSMIGYPAFRSKRFRKLLLG